MDSEKDVAFEVMPASTDELDAYEVLFNHPQIEAFMDALQRQADGSWVMTIHGGDQVFTFKDGGPGAIRRLAIEFITFDPKREEKRRAEERAAEAATIAAEQAAQKKQALLRNALLGGQ